VDITKELPTVISFCSGYGGIERGLDLAGFEHRVIAYVEIEAFAIANLVAKMESGQLAPAPIYSNLKTFPAHLFRDKVSLITGGYPCQPFSTSGNRLGADDPRHLWPYIRRHIESIRPLSCFFENVEGHISLGLRDVIGELEQDGYQTTWGIFSAREVGAPHQRKRVYILGNSEHIGQPQRKHEADGLRHPSRLKKGLSESASHAGANILADSNGVRCDKRQLPDRVSQRSVVRSEIKGCSGDSGEDVADSDSERWAKHDRKQGSSSKGKRTDKGRGQTIRSGATGANILADSNSIGLEEHGHCEPSNVVKASENVANSDSASGQGRGIPCRVHEKHPDTNGSSDEFREEIAQLWLPEPRLGRVVDGCADRVDRLRLLGNGVVPQTAAKAWITLNERFYMRHVYE
jgi:DNA (cytosine-5)-methyltransferase 1